MAARADLHVAGDADEVRRGDVRPVQYWPQVRLRGRAGLLLRRVGDVAAGVLELDNDWLEDPELLKEMLRLGEKDLEYVPSYAFRATVQALIKLKKLESEKTIRPGLYYIVLTDLCGSTKASTILGPEINKSRIERFINYTVEAWKTIEQKSGALFIKEAGDASLFLFKGFADILNWDTALNAFLEKYNAELPEDGRKGIMEMRIKTVVHLGEVAFSGYKNPVALAVNQVFKIEKEFGPGELGITDAVRQANLPMITGGEMIIEKHGHVVLPGDDIERPLWRVLNWGEIEEITSDDI